MDDRGVLVVGASQAGVQLAVSLRALGHAGPITLLGDENHRPYQRPPLSKDFLQDKVTKEALIFRSREFWAEQRIDVVQNERVVRIERDPARPGAGVAHARSGAAFPFDRLALTVGARARKLAVPGAGLPGVLTLRNADDALELKARIPAVRDVVVVGGGFIGLEAAASLHQLGKRVTVVEAGPRLAARAVGTQTSGYLLRHHRAEGIDVLLDTQVHRIVGEGDTVTGVDLGDRVVPAQLVLVGIGVLPNTELAASMGLDCADGIVVDERGVASDGTTVAVGDCADQPNPAPGGPAGSRIRFESVNNAVEQAKVAAAALLGRPAEPVGVPWFWSNQGALKLQIAGLSAGHDRTVVRRDDARHRFSVLYYRDERIIAADCVNAPLDFLAVKSALAKGAVIPHRDAEDPSVALKSLTRAA